MCPNCSGEVKKIAEEWICQSPCGFRSSSPEPEVWLALSMVLSMYRMADKFAAKYDAAHATSNIKRDFRKFLEREM